MRIAYVTSYDPTDRLQWSGLGSAILESLRAQGLDVTPIGPLRRRFQLLGRIKAKLYEHLVGRSYDFDREALVGWDYAQQVSGKLNIGEYDLVFSPGSIPISRLRCRQPIVMWTDATFGSLTSIYDQYRTLAVESLRAGHRTERMALSNCGLAIFSSNWAAQSAIHQYGTDPEKVKVVPFGANFREPPNRDVALRSVSDRPVDSCKLITIGVDWIRKGIPRAIELASALNCRGLPTQLTVVGCQPPHGVVLPKFVNLIGFIDKRSRDGEQQLSRLLEESHFHVLFSIAECCAVVLAEANAHAVPNIANDVGGNESAVINGRGGWLFDPVTPIDRVADYLMAHMRNRSRYLELALAARREYDERLNWQVAGAVVKDYLRDLVCQTSKHARPTF